MPKLGNRARVGYSTKKSPQRDSEPGCSGWKESRGESQRCWCKPAWGGNRGSPRRLERGTGHPAGVWEGEIPFLWEGRTRQGEKQTCLTNEKLRDQYLGSPTFLGAYDMVKN